MMAVSNHSFAERLRNRAGVILGVADASGCVLEQLAFFEGN